MRRLVREAVKCDGGSTSLRNLNHALPVPSYEQGQRCACAIAMLVLSCLYQTDNVIRREPMFIVGGNSC